MRTDPTPAVLEDDARKARERDFHDARHGGGDDPRMATRPFYRIVAESHGRYRESIRRGCRGKRVLEYGCGPGSEGFSLAESGARVEGIDISPVAVAIAAERAAELRLTGAVFSVQDAERTTFADGSFDLVVGSGILHHLDLDRSYAEIARVLRPDGRAVFLEPLGHNPLINAYRRRTPALRTADEHPLLVRDLRAAERHFAHVELEYFHLATLAAIPFGRTPVFAPVRRILAALDRAIFSALPPLRKHAWMCILELSAPRR